MSYSQLLKFIQSIQIAYDKEHPSFNADEEQLLPSLILKLLDAQATILDVESGKNLVDSDVECWLAAMDVERHSLNQLEQISTDFHLEISLVDLLPTPGSKNWLKLGEHASLMANWLDTKRFRLSDKEIHE
ncbi:uncharacterized protein MELLADRAFT_69145 [Melampsora larici-populina 98AG31]|uniref:Uncharacterized protein n=1 Tax=Melampsora larici-populina (strain 98AG31 / pathotype 3-4-7) TaxID=747676 RepID=F4S9K0_MELLP|nr:uncharacterized protein MELLADRAFT_69145 [Melampsora larici-populina 98AG31]EGF98687.1 hypothetical protein MELLADRAFT_69145 [Melampsora larici-populina 98AG31]